jgi:hypothetical protein
MISRLRPRLNHATVVAYLALFVALGGSAYSAALINGKNIKNKSIAGKKLKNRTITAGKIKKNALTGAELNESKLGTVPRAANAVMAANAASATTAGSAGTATTAVNANALGGTTASSFVKGPTEATRLVDTPGNPSFAASWANSGITPPVGFYKDQFGVVHLQGGVNPPNSTGTIFTLPAGYRPSPGPSLRFAVESDGHLLTAIEIQPGGAVASLTSQNDLLLLEGITFRAAG